MSTYERQKEEELELLRQVVKNQKKPNVSQRLIVMILLIPIMLFIVFCIVNWLASV